jgi:hypothetical protein
MALHLLAFKMTRPVKYSKLPLPLCVCVLLKETTALLCTADRVQCLLHHYNFVYTSSSEKSCSNSLLGPEKSTYSLSHNSSSGVIPLGR